MRLDELPIQLISGIWDCKPGLSETKPLWILLHYITAASSKNTVSIVVKKETVSTHFSAQRRLVK